LVDELAKERIMFQFNLRDDDHGEKFSCWLRKHVTLLSARTGYPPPDTSELRNFFKRRPDETDDKLADRYAAFLYVLFRAARLLLEPIAEKDYSLLAGALYELLSKDQRSPDKPPPLRKELYEAVVKEAEVRQCFGLLDRSL
jgi:hypothetical protein